jgi:GNAT superfamily N-acetyltransferase
MRIEHGTGADAGRLLALFDDAVAWLLARGQSAQWGSEPFSARPSSAERAQGWAAGGGLWFVVDGTADAGAIVLGAAHDYVPPPSRAELYVQVLLTAAAWRGRGVGARLIEHAAELARAAGAEQLRVDCWDGVPELPRSYERLGFARSGSFDVGGWPGAILVREL